MNRGEIVFEAGLSIGLERTEGSDELKLLQRWVNRGVEDVLQQTHCFLDEGNMDLDAGATGFRLDQKILAVADVHINGTNQLEFINWRDLDEMLTSGPIAGVPAYASVKGDFMRIVPAPSADSVVTWFYVPKPDPMLADGTTADDGKDPSTPNYGGVPTQYHDAVLMYVLWKASEYDNKNAAQVRGTPDYQANYRTRVIEIRKQNRRKGGPALPAARIGYPDRGGIPRRSDVYP